MMTSHRLTPLQVVLDEIDLRASATTPATLQAVTDLAIEIAREGREGRRDDDRNLRSGNLLTEILPELWLLHRYLPHIAQPALTSAHEHNHAIVLERPG
jgi:hypothetical protein